MQLRIIRIIQRCAFMVLAASLAYIQIYNGKDYANRADKNYVRLIPYEAPRGIIWDRNGQALVRNQIEFDVTIFNSRGKKTALKIMEQVAVIVNQPLATLEKRFKKNYLVPFTPTSIFKTTDRKLALAIDEANIDGIMILPKGKRVQTFPNALTHVVGYVNKPTKKHKFLKKYGYSLSEDIGYSGLEKQYDAYLRGTSGGRQIEVNSRGKVVNIIAEELPRRGNDIHVTIDSKLQNLAYESLKGYRGSFVMIEAFSGRVITLASSPTFDVNKFRSSSAYISEVFTDKQRPSLNRPLQGQYPMGSVFKPLVALAALESKIINTKTEFFCDGAFRLGRTKFRCNAVHDIENVSDALAHSCNVFFYNIGLKSGVNLLSDYAHMAGLGELTGIDLPNEKKGIVPTPAWKKKRFKQSWYTGDTINMSIGQGYHLATPLQVTILMNYFATDGLLVKPYLLERVENIAFTQNRKLDYNPKREALFLVKDGLRRVVADKKGTARNLEKLNLDIAGKTGTAQAPRAAAHGWFSGFFPYRNPKYTVTVMLENCGSSHVAADVLEKFLKKVKEQKLLPDLVDDAVG